MLCYNILQYDFEFYSLHKSNTCFHSFYETNKATTQNKSRHSLLFSYNGYDFRFKEVNQNILKKKLWEKNNNNYIFLVIARFNMRPLNSISPKSYSCYGVSECVCVWLIIVACCCKQEKHHFVHSLNINVWM